VTEPQWDEEIVLPAIDEVEGRTPQQPHNGIGLFQILTPNTDEEN
jgi:hypothetical protein